jgi:PAS domain S-box-containing protein
MFYYTIRRAYAPTQLASSSSGEVPMSQVQDKKQDGIWIIDAEARTVYANDRIAEILGTTSQEMKGRPSFDYLFPEGVEAAQRLFDSKRKAIALHSNSNFDGRTAQRFG